MFKNHRARLLLLFALTISCSYESIEITRTEFFEKSCPSRDRSEFRRYINSFYSNRFYLLEQTRDMYKADGQQILKALFQNNPIQLYREYTKQTKSLILNFIVLYVGLGLIVVLAPILCCCLFIPDKCRVCEFDKKNYCFFFSVMFCLAVIGLSIYVTIRITDTFPIYDDFKCSLSIVGNDLINGNADIDISSEDYYFSGISRLSKNYGYFYKLYNELINTTKQFQFELNSDMLKIIQQGEYAYRLTQIIPDLYRGQLALSYKYPLLQTHYTSNGQSYYYYSYKRFQSDKIDSLTSAIVNNLAQESLFLISNITSNLKNLNSSASSFNKIQNIDESHDAGQINLKENLRQAQNFNFKLEQFFSLYEDSGYSKAILITLYSMLGLLMLFAMFYVVNICCACCKDQYILKCSKLFCMVFWLLGVICFLSTLLVNMVFPTLFYFCSQMDKKIENQTEFRSFFSKQFPQNIFVDWLPTCFSRENSSALFYLANPQISLAFDHLAPLTASASSISQKTLSKLQKNYDKLLWTISNTLYSKTIDIQDKEALQQLKKIQNIQLNYSSGYYDKWVFNPNESVCGNYNVVTNTTCSSKQKFEKKQIGCEGCIYTSQIFGFYNSAQQLQSGLKSKYRGKYQFQQQDQNRYQQQSSQYPDYFIEDLVNIWENYYNVKRQVLTLVRQRAISANLSSSIFIGHTEQAILPITQEYLSKVQDESYSPFFQPKFGIFEGQSCSIVGDDIRASQKIVCSQQSLDFLLQLKIILTILSFLILANLCCICCVSRQKPQEQPPHQNKKKPEDYQMEPKFHFQPYFQKAESDRALYAKR